MRSFTFCVLLIGLVCARQAEAVDFQTTGSQTLAVPAGTYDNIESFNTSQLTMGAGVTADNEARSYDMSTFFLQGGSVAVDAEAFNDSTFNMSGGQVNRHAESFDSGTFNLTGGLVAVDANAFATSTFNMLGGQVGRDAIGFGSSVFNMSQGTVLDDALVTNTATFNLSGGQVNGDAAAFEDSVFNLTGGTVGNDLEAHGNSVVNVTGGSIGDDLQSFNNSTVNFSGGRTSGAGFGFVDARDNSTMNMSGGFTWDAQARDNSQFHLTGGDIFSDFFAFHDADIFIYASDFGPNPDHFAGQVISLGDLSVDPQGNPAFNGDVIRITFPDGTFEQFDFRAENSGEFAWTGTLNFIGVPPIPEPGTAALLGLAALGLARRR